MDLRCANKKHGAVVDDHTVEIMCRSKFCGAQPGRIVVIHQFDLRTGDSITKKYNDINSLGKAR